MRAPTLTFKRARNLRRRFTLPEGLLWRELRSGKLAGSRWRRQHPIGPFILDFYCPAAKLRIEVDGMDHVWRDDGHDARRTAWLAEHGVRVVRFSAPEVLSDEGLVRVLESIAEVLATR